MLVYHTNFIELQQVRGFDAGMSDGAQGVAAPLVRGDEQNVLYGLLRHCRCPPEITNVIRF